jgi:hypothetical protein
MSNSVRHDALWVATVISFLKVKQEMNAPKKRLSLESFFLFFMVQNS